MARVQKECNQSLSARERVEEFSWLTLANRVTDLPAQRTSLIVDSQQTGRSISAPPGRRYPRFYMHPSGRENWEIAGLA